MCFFLCFIKARTRSFLLVHLTIHPSAFCVWIGTLWRNCRISFNTEGNYGAGLIVVNSTSCQWNSHTAVTELQFGRTEIALNHTIISSHWQLSLPLFFLSGCYLVLNLNVEIRWEWLLIPLLVIWECHSALAGAKHVESHFSIFNMPATLRKQKKTLTSFPAFFFSCPKPTAHPLWYFQVILKEAQSRFMIFDSYDWLPCPLFFFPVTFQQWLSCFSCRVHLWECTEWLLCPGSLCQYTLLDF